MGKVLRKEEEFNLTLKVHYRSIILDSPTIYEVFPFLFLDYKFRPLLRRYSLHKYVKASKQETIEYCQKILKKYEEIKEDKEIVLEGRKAREKLINYNLNLVRSIVNKYVGKGCEYSDLLQVGVLGLLQGIYRFDPELGYRLSTYVTPWIHQAIRQEISFQGRLIPLPSRVWNLISEIRKVKISLYKEGNDITIKNLSFRLGVSTTKIQEALIYWNRTQVDILNEFVYIDKQDDEESFDMDKNQIWSALGQLPSLEQNIIKSYYGLEGEQKSISEIAEMVSLPEHFVLSKLEEAKDLLGTILS